MFQYLHAYDIIECNLPQTTKQKNDIKNLPKDVQKSITKKLKSKNCIRTVYSLMDGIAKTIMPKIVKNKKFAYSYVLQILHIIYKMKEHNYSHNDFHRSNIGYQKTSDTHFVVFGKKVELQGYRFKAVHFGNVSHLSKTCRKCRLNNDIRRSIFCLVTYQDGSKLVHARGDVLKSMSFIKKLFDLNTIYKNGDKDWRDDYIYLYQLLFTERFCKANKLKNQKIVSPIDTVDLVYLIQNKDDLKRVIIYFMEKIQYL